MSNPLRTILALCLLMSLLIAVTDFLTPLEMSLLSFYWLPVYIATWHCGALYGLCFSVLGVGLANLTDWLTGQSFSHPFFLVWSVASQLFSFAVFVWVLSSLRSASEFEAVAAMRRDILSLLSHEVNNAITILKITRDMMKDGDPKPITQRKESYEIFGRVLLSMELTTSNFLNNARSEAGRLTVTPGAVDLRLIVEELSGMFAPVFKQRSQTLVMNVPADTPKVWADKSALTLILNNLIGNAVKYTPEGGRITVQAERPANSPSALRISVADTGIGIDPEDKQKLFQGFTRSTEAKSMAKGAGLGLKTVHDLLQLHGTDLEIAGARGRGSTFTFTLPMAGAVAAG